MHFKHLIWNLTRSELDMANVLINIVEVYDKFDIGHTSIDYNMPIYMLELTYHDLAAALGYSALDDKVISELTMILNNLSKTQSSVYYTNDDDSDRLVDHSTLIMKYGLSSTKMNNVRDLDKRFTLMLSTSLVKVLREHPDLFKKLYTHDRYDLRSKYSTLLYDKLSEEAKGSNTVAINYTMDEFIEIVDFELSETTNVESWTKINSNILKRVSKEINEKTNMYLSYRAIKEKLSITNRTQTAGIRFEVSLAPESEETPEYFDNDFLMERKISYYMEKEINRKVAELKKFNDSKVKNEENYRFIEKQKLQKQRVEFKAKVEIQELVNRIKYNNTGEHGLVCFFDYEGCNYVTVNSDHKLMDIETQRLLTNSATQTYSRIKEFLNNEGEYDLVDVDNRKEYSISYSKG